MDFAALVEDITRLVCERLETAMADRAGLLPRPATVAKTSVLVILGRSAPAKLGGFDYGAFTGTLTTLGRTSPVAFHVLPSERFAVPDGAVRVAVGADWGAGSEAHRALYLPNVGVGVLAKLALLIADEPAVEAALHFLLQNKPVIVGWDDLQMVLSHEGYHGRGVQEVVRSHVRAVQAMGIQLGVGKEPATHLANALGTSGGTTVARGKAVVTEADLYELSKRGQAKVIYPPGSIVTALAWDAATRLGIQLEIA
ncbi:MAG TPA: hypothetical protein VGO93_21640 [Candidatus Xenobia bacterium]